MSDAADKLIEDALFLRMYGERPPGAPQRPEAETWREWDRRAEIYLRGDDTRPRPVLRRVGWRVPPAPPERQRPIRAILEELGL